MPVTLPTSVFAAPQDALADLVSESSVFQSEGEFATAAAAKKRVYIDGVSGDLAIGGARRPFAVIADLKPQFNSKTGGHVSGTMQLQLFHGIAEENKDSSDNQGNVDSSFAFDNFSGDVVQDVIEGSLAAGKLYIRLINATASKFRSDVPDPENWIRQDFLVTFGLG